MTCFESHLPGARHRDAGAIRKVAPSAGEAASAAAAEQRPPARIIVRTPPVGGGSSGPSSSSNTSTPQEVLVIASRLKDYIQARGDMNTSASVMDVLSAHLRVLCERGIENARTDGRKTVMDRDFEFLRK